MRRGRIERERILRGWTRAQLAEAAHIDPKTLRDLLSGRRHPTMGTVGALSRALDLPLVEVISIVEHPVPRWKPAVSPAHTIVQGVLAID